MIKTKTVVKILSAAVSVCMFAGLCSAAEQKLSFVPSEPVMHAASVKKGMKGYLKTVLSGKEITKHSVSVEGVIKRKTSPKELILIKITDKKLLAAGGAAAGMSGSPVYVNGKLIGAFAYGWSFADKSLGLVTPIDEMCRAMDWLEFVPSFTRTKEEDDKDFMAVDNRTPEEFANLPGESELEKIPERDPHPPVYIEDFEEIKENTIRPPFLLIDDELSYDIQTLKKAKLVPLSFALQADGFGESSLKRLENKLGTSIIPLAAASDSESGVKLNSRLQPGSAIGVVLAWGDITLGGIGTLTSVDRDGRFLAFGHPMLCRGSVAMPLTESEIIRIIPGIRQAFKLGNIGAINGMVTQDRPEAIGGWFGKLPPSISYDVLVHDLDNSRLKAKRFRTIVDPYMAPEIGQEAVLSILQNEWARGGEGTLMLRLGINGGGLKEAWERRDIFYSRENALEAIEKEMKLLTEIFALNKFEEINPFGIEVEALLTRIPRVAFIDSLKIINEKEFYSPGDVIELEATIRPWRKKPVVKKISLRVPKKAVGMCEIDVRAGGIEPQKETAVLLGLNQITSLESLLRELSVQETNNMLIAEIGGPEMPEKKKKKHENTVGRMNKKPRTGNHDEDGGEDENNDANREIDVEDDDDTAKMDKIPKLLTETRLMSEIQKERIEEGSLRILDTNYYMDGILRKFIKI
ncbi:MAG: SpoIVB peptidase S55 domain-containing protein, partial [Synergistaceae bacterium]|nr:SpoIVB peptidase S55 domain-containing protein [Synergistaceae bacterium]